MVVSSDNGRPRPRILICDPIHPDGVALLREHAEVDVVEEALTPAELEQRVRDYDALVVRSRTQVTAGVIHAGYRLKAIARAGAGLDNIDVHAAQSQGVAVINAPDANTLAVAEHTFALMLALARRIVQADQSMKAGRWEKSKLMGTGLAGKTLGIIGFGRIGRQVAKRAAAFDMRILVNQPRLTPELALELGVEKVDLPDLLARADFVTLHVPLRPENIGLIGREELAQMKPTAYLINTARGGIVDEDALLEALEAGRLAGAGLDVFQGEPNVKPELVRHPRVVATPHIAASTEDAQRNAALTVARQLIQILERTGASETLKLRVVPVDAVVPHEAYDPKRVEALARRIPQDGILVNPPVVTQWGDVYVVLDGATRVTAFRRLGYPHIVVQIVDLARDEVQLHTWYHAVHGMDSEDLLALTRRIPGLTVEALTPEETRQALADPQVLAVLHLADGRAFRLRVQPDGAQDWLDALNQLVAAYTEAGTVARTLTTDLEALRAQYPDLAGLFVFPQFEVSRVLEVASQGRTMPAGITRFVVPGRVLRLNAPLDVLRSHEPLSAKSAWLDQFVQARLAHRKVRYYQEPVILLDD